ncbi:hypothetical protein MKX03_023900 [Papaver bracteatum]|nr:hypothetical protein MKX03_023900 [Papaver bracteatum]
MEVNDVISVEDTSKENDAISTFSCVRMKPLTTVSSRSRVENPYDETQVFVEVQFRTKPQIVYLTRNNLLFDLGSRETVEARELFAPTIIKLFQINFCWPLLSMDILDNLPSKARFWNFFKRVVSRFGNKVVKRNIKSKKSVLNIVVRVEHLIVAHHYWNNKAEEELAEFHMEFCRLKSRNNEDLEETQSRTISIFQTIRINKLDDNMVDDGGDADGCVICLDEFKKGNKVIRFPCEHLFHSECIIKWINKSQPDTVCPTCMEELTPDLTF